MARIQAFRQLRIDVDAYDIVIARREADARDEADISSANDTDPQDDASCLI